MSTYYKECFVEKIYHYDALDKKVWEELKSGTEVSLALDKKDAKEKVKVKFKVNVEGNEKEGTLGLLSVEDSKSMLPFFEANRDDVFSAKICFNGDIDSENKRVKIVVFIESKKE